MKYLKAFVVVTVVFTLPFLASAANYIAIVDAGSSGSRIHLFNVENKEGIVEFCSIELNNNKVQPGISNYANSVEQHICPLIESLRDGLPQGVEESDVKFYFLATAGMRTVAPNQQKDIYTKLSEYLKTKTKLKIETISTISGKMEGVFDWIAVNALEGKLAATATYGVMDMGGASLQVAFADNASTEILIPVKVGNRNFLINSCSYLGIGADQMRGQYTDNANCFPKGLELSDVTGNGNYNQCLLDLRPIIREVHKVKPLPLSVLWTTDFVGISNFYYMTNSKPFNMGSIASASDIKAKGELFAQMTWEEMKSKWMKDPYLFSYYIKSAFIVEFLAALGFGPNTKIKVVNKINGVEVSWALGAAIYYAEGNKQAERVSSQIPIGE